MPMSLLTSDELVEIQTDSCRGILPKTSMLLFANIVITKT